MAKPFQEWEFRQDHHEDIELALREAGCVDSKNQIRRMRPEVGKLMGELGHDSFLYERCRCSKIAKELCKQF